MNKYNTLKIVNPILLVLVLNQLVTGLVGGKLSHEAFEILHEGGGILLAVAVALHLILNWGWVQSTYRKKH